MQELGVKGVGVGGLPCRSWGVKGVGVGGFRV